MALPPVVKRLKCLDNKCEAILKKRQSEVISRKDRLPDMSTWHTGHQSLQAYFPIKEAFRLKHLILCGMACLKSVSWILPV